jgi:hypothetical protein
MNKIALAIALIAISSPTLVSAATASGSATQKGSLLIFPSIEALNSQAQAGGFISDTLIQITNDSSVAVNLQCAWGTTEGNSYNVSGGNAASNAQAVKARRQIRNNHYMSFSFVLTKNQPAIFWAGDLSILANNQFSTGGIDKLVPTVNVPEFNFFQDGFQTDAGELKCWAVNRVGDREIHHNHLVGKATVVRFAEATNANSGQAHEYNAWAFQAHYYDKKQQYASNSIDYTSKLLPTPGIIDLDGKEYDQCPSALTGQFIPTRHSVLQGVNKTKINVANCHQDLSQDAQTHITKLTYSVWNAHEVKYTGAHECMGAWYESDLGAIFPHFTYKTLKTDSAYFRVQPTKSALCNQGSQKKVAESDIEVSGIVGIQVNDVGGAFLTSSSLTGLTIPPSTTNQTVGKGQILWDTASGDFGKK